MWLAVVSLVVGRFRLDFSRFLPQLKNRRLDELGHVQPAAAGGIMEGPTMINLANLALSPADALARRNQSSSALGDAVARDTEKRSVLGANKKDPQGDK